MKTCPLDLGLWRIEPVLRPDWWPKADGPQGEIDTVPAQIWEQIDHIWRSQEQVFGDGVLLQANGQVYDNKTVYDLEVLGAFQRCDGSASPDAEQVVDGYTERPYLTYQPDRMPFDGTMRQRSVDSLQMELEDWLVIPAARAVHVLSIPRWDYWKEFRGIWIPLPYSDLQLRCSGDGVCIEEGGTQIAKWQVWTHGLREKERGMLSSPATGGYLIAKRSVINDLAAETGTVFCWICRMIGHHREYDHQDWKTYTDCRMFGTTNIVLPFP